MYSFDGTRLVHWMSKQILASQTLPGHARELMDAQTFNNGLKGSLPLRLTKEGSQKSLSTAARVKLSTQSSSAAKAHTSRMCSCHSKTLSLIMLVTLYSRSQIWPCKSPTVWSSSCMRGLFQYVHCKCEYIFVSMRVTWHGTRREGGRGSRRQGRRKRKGGRQMTVEGSRDREGTSGGFNWYFFKSRFSKSTPPDSFSTLVLHNRNLWSSNFFHAHSRFSPPVFQSWQSLQACSPGSAYWPAFVRRWDIQAAWRRGIHFFLTMLHTWDNGFYQQHT